MAPANNTTKRSSEEVELVPADILDSKRIRRDSLTSTSLPRTRIQLPVSRPDTTSSSSTQSPATIKPVVDFSSHPIDPDIPAPKGLPATGPKTYSSPSVPSSLQDLPISGASTIPSNSLFSGSLNALKDALASTASKTASTLSKPASPGRKLVPTLPPSLSISVSPGLYTPPNKNPNAQLSSIHSSSTLLPQVAPPPTHGLLERMVSALEHNRSAEEHALLERSVIAQERIAEGIWRLVALEEAKRA